MKLNRIPRATVLALIVTSLALNAGAQTMANFQASNLEVSGGETRVTDDFAAFYTGSVNIDATGRITGEIIRRNFAAAAKTSTYQKALVNPGQSRITGPIRFVNASTNTFISDGYSETRVENVYNADFYLGTWVTNFFVKGQAEQRISTSVATNIWQEPSFDEQTQQPTMVTVTNVTTNNYRSVSLGGVSFNSEGRRGIFDAGE